MPVRFMDIITRQYVRANPATYFVFGDNEARAGFGGQAKEMRGEPNAIGVRTKRLPSNTPDVFWYEKDVRWCINMVEDDLRRIDRVLYDGLGTGLAGLPELAPSVHAFICKRVTAMGRRYGVVA